MTKYTVKEILLDLVSVQSDTGTAMEKTMGEKIAKYIEEDPYFQEHPDQWGCESGDDLFGRPVVWALKKGKTDRTVILSGHYDAVEINSYGKLKPYALKPQELKAKMLLEEYDNEELKKDLQSDDWMVGRGTGDMKAGVAAALHTLLDYDCDENGSIMFTAICDEENLAAGTLASLPILKEVRDKFGLDYRLSVIGEPHFPSEHEKTFTAYKGGTGKMLPVIVAKGKLAHAAQALNGLNSAHMIAEIGKNLDLNTDLCTEDKGMATQVPILQVLKDQKWNYDVSLPEYSAACLNVLFLGTDSPRLIIDKIADICKHSMEDVIKKYEKACEYAMPKGLLKKEDKKEYEPVVYRLEELEEIVAGKVENFADLKKDIIERLRTKINSGELILSTASITYIRELLEASFIDYPVVIVGIAPPYMPATCNDYLNRDFSKLEGILEKALKESDLTMDLWPYIPGMGDISYMTCPSPEKEEAVSKNVVLAPDLFDVPYRIAHDLDTPCYYIGPLAKDVHQWSERVYMPHVEKTVPHIFRQFVKEI